MRLLKDCKNGRPLVVDESSDAAAVLVCMPEFGLYAIKRGERPLIRAAGAFCHSTPQ